MRLMKGYDSESLQPYSLVNAPALKELGIDLVEMGYWRRATQAQGIIAVTEHRLDLGSGPIKALADFTNDASVHEYLVDIDEILKDTFDESALGLMMGTDMGYDTVGQHWSVPFACGHSDIIDKPPIPLQNDPLST